MGEYHFGRSGISNIRKSVYLVMGAVILWLSFPFSCSGEGDGPERFMVEQDWKTIVKNDQGCNSCVRIGRVTVLDISAKKSSASARIEIVGDWIGLSDCHKVSGPCSGFSASGGISQVVQKTLRYKKYDSGWKLESNFRKSESGSRHTKRKQ